MTGIYRLADMVVQVESLYEEVHTMCADYIVGLPSKTCGQKGESQAEIQPDFFIRTCEKDIERERKESEETRKEEGLPPYTFDDSYLETLAVYRQIATAAVNRGRLLMHGSCLAIRPKNEATETSENTKQNEYDAVIFTAKSGTGKSTHVRLWRKLFGQRALIVNDDKPLLQVGESGVWAYGTPWDGKHHLSTNMRARLKAICILTRANENTIRQIPPREAVQTLLNQIYRPDDPMMMLKTLELIDLIGQNVSFYILGCNMDDEAAVVSANGMGFDI